MLRFDRPGMGGHAQSSRAARRFVPAGSRVPRSHPRGELLCTARAARGKWFRDEDCVALHREEFGRPSVPPSQLAIALLLQAHDSASDEAAIARSAFDLRWKVALGLELAEKLCAKSRLQHFRARRASRHLYRPHRHRRQSYAGGRLRRGLVLLPVPRAARRGRLPRHPRAHRPEKTSPNGPFSAGPLGLRHRRLGPVHRFGEVFVAGALHPGIHRGCVNLVGLRQIEGRLGYVPFT